MLILVVSCVVEVVRMLCDIGMSMGVNEMFILVLFVVVRFWRILGLCWCVLLIW